MSAFGRNRWARVVKEARDYLVALGELEAGDPVPREEVVETLRANGYGDAISPVDVVDDAVGDELVEADGGVRVGEPDPTMPERYVPDDDGKRPLDAFDTRGYAFNPGDQPEDMVRARDAALTLLASCRGPALATHRDDEKADEDWYLSALRTASDAVEHAIVLALLVGCDTEGDENDETAKTAANEAGIAGSEGDNPWGETSETGLAEDRAEVSGEWFHPETIVDRDVWVTWILDGVGRKRPVAPWQNGHAYPAEWAEGLDDDERPETDYETARRWVEFDLGDAGLALPDDAQSDELDLGILLPAERPEDVEDRLALIDWDDVRDPETEEIHPIAAEYIRRFGGYVEVSTSGEGLHQFVTGGLRHRGKFIAPIADEPFVGDDLPQVEIYDAGRHVAMTGRHVAGTDRDVVEGQDMIDEVVTEYADAEVDAGHRRFDPKTGEDVGADEDRAGTAGLVPEPDTGDYTGPSTDELRETKPDDRSLAYHAAVETFYRGGGNAGGYASLQNWRLEGFVAALGELDDLDREAIKKDLAGAYLDETEVEQNCVHRTPERVEYAYDRAASDRLAAPSYDTLARYGVLPPVFVDDGEDDSEEWRDDPREVSATVDVRRAWDAAGRVTPDEVDDGRLNTTTDGEAFAAGGDRVDVVRAVAIAEGLVGGGDAPLNNRYPQAYALAREEYGAPLPRYYTTSDAIAKFDAVLDVIGEATYWDLNVDALETEETAEDDDVGGDAVCALDPAWRDSESGRSVLVFPSGTIWDADTERVLDIVRFAALDAGIIRRPEDPLEGEDFTHAYGVARDVLGAPLPRWEPAVDGVRKITAQLPPAEEFVDARDLDGVDRDRLDEAREDVEALLREATADSDAPTVVEALPATGKTTGMIKTATDRAVSYLAPRKRLQQQAMDKADRWDVDARLLPVFAEARVDSAILSSAISHVREHGKDCLRDRWTVLSHALDGVDGEVDAEAVFADEENEEDDIDLNRATCPTAEGEHGPAWALAVHVARALGYTPREIHTEAEGLFGAPLPCDDGDGCPYAAGWDAANDPDDTADLLVGYYTHAHVAGVRTRFDRAPDGSTETAPRAVVFDEFPGEAFVREFDDHADDNAAWLARSLCEGVEDRRDMYNADLWGDTWTRAWLNGEADNIEAVGEALSVLARAGDLLEAREGATEVREEVDEGLLDALGVADPLKAIAAGDDAVKTFNALRAALDDIDPEQPGAALTNWIEPIVSEPLGRATMSGTAGPDVTAVGVDELPIAGDLAALVKNAIDAAETGGDGAEGRLRAAIKALRGGQEGCRRLAAWADDGYAHPDAHHLLTAVAAPSGETTDSGKRIGTSAWAFDDEATDGTTLDVVDTAGRATTVLDRNGHGALLHTPPARTAVGGEDVPLVGLDATARSELWATAVGEDVNLRDVHDTEAERARFLEEALDLRVIQAADQPRYYSGSPGSKDTNGDVALLQRLAEEYAGINAPRERGAAPTRVGRPAAITTKDVREVLEGDDRLNDAVAAWDHYGNVKGSNHLGDHRLAAVLGCQHYGDDAVERFAALAGEEVDTDRRTGRGAGLDYGSDVANAYLQHMTEDQTTQAILRFARGGSGATVVARTSALRDDLPVVGEGQVVETWNETATAIAGEYRTLGGEFTTADVRDVVDVTPRQVRRVLAELAEAGYVRAVEEGEGRATTYERVDDPGAGEVDLPTREEAVATPTPPVNKYYTWNVRVHGGDVAPTPVERPGGTEVTGAPPAPAAVDRVEPPS